MKIEKRDGSDERRILTGMIVDRIVLGKIAAKWQKGMFRTSYANLVASWAIDYYQRYDKAPKKNIEGKFETWAEINNDEDIIRLVEKFLGNLSDEYENLSKESNSEYVVDLAGKYFNRIKLVAHSESIQGDLDSGDIDKAEKRIKDYNKIEIGIGSGIDALHDAEAIRAAFEKQTEPLIAYSGALGKFFGNSLQRDALIAFMAPEKRGKTFWLMDIAFQGLKRRRRVAFFQAGDLSQDQMMQRIMSRVTRHPLTAQDVYIPISMEWVEGEEMPNVEFETRTFKKDLTWRYALKYCEEKIQKRLRSKESYLKLSMHDTSTLSVEGIGEVIQGWERNEWIPDVVIIDYADILDIGTKDEYRHRIDRTWGKLRGLSLKYHCLVIVATQADAKSYETHTLGRQNFTEDKRKLAHVNGMIGINQTDDEKENQIMRLNWIVRRDSNYNEQRCVHVAGCLDIGSPAIRSTF